MHKNQLSTFRCIIVWYFTQYYKLVITDNDIVQFAEFEIWGSKG